ncbi:hypothetical protein EC957_007240 [Mortierella hygrophila]|uniref:SEC7 domain-containing protein n=1 Tax=Mortierella hygrophila TaxID=979708 RepID=A0A9P6EXA9_9FUNG|nr:hypothetical protein EC957_007240 [Mortierella hygrophila]
MPSPSSRSTSLPSSTQSPTPASPSRSRGNQFYHSDPIPQSPTRPSIELARPFSPAPSQPQPQPPSSPTATKHTSLGEMPTSHRNWINSTSHNTTIDQNLHSTSNFTTKPASSSSERALQFNTSEIERSFQALLKKQPIATPGPSLLQSKTHRHLHPKDASQPRHLLTTGTQIQLRPLPGSPNSSHLSHSPIFGSPAAEHARHWIKSAGLGRDHISDSESEQRESSDHDSYEDSQQQQWQIDYDHHIAGHVELETEAESSSSTAVDSKEQQQLQQQLQQRQQLQPSWAGKVHPMFNMSDPQGVRDQGLYPGLISPTAGRPSILTKDQCAIHPLSPVPPSPSSGTSTPRIPQSRSPEIRPQVVLHPPGDSALGFDLGSIPPLAPIAVNQPLPPLPPLPAQPPSTPDQSRLRSKQVNSNSSCTSKRSNIPTKKSSKTNLLAVKPIPFTEKKPISLTNPPRKCIHHGKILQVINTSTVKDRYLFLFSDILVIAKPMSDGHPTIDSRFQVKDVIELKKISLSLSRDKYDSKSGDTGSSGNRKIPPVLAEFIHTFDQSPIRALNIFIQKRALHPDPVSVAHLLFKTPELSRTQLALFLSNPANKHVYRAFLDQCQFAGVLLDEALRTLLSRLSLPNRVDSQRSNGHSDRTFNSVDYLLEEFTRRWYEVNVNVVVYDASIAHKLVIAMIVLNAQLHNNEGAGIVRDREEVGTLVRPRVASQPSTPTIPSTPVMESTLPAPSVPAPQQYLTMELDDLTLFPTPTKDSFVEMFQLLDQQRIVSRDTLLNIFLSISHQPLDIEFDKMDTHTSNPKSNLVAARKLWPILISPAVLPPRLTLKIPSDSITITVPVLNPHFSIHVGGRDLKCEPSVLEFGSHRSQRFKITGLIPGKKTLTIHPRLVSDKGSPEQFYDLQNLPTKHTVAIERQFMRHTFQISLLNDLGTRRRYLFGTSSAAEKDEWARVLTECLLVAKGQNAVRLNEHTGLEQSIGLQILKELLLGVEASDEDELGATQPNGKPEPVPSLPIPIPLPGVPPPALGLGIPLDGLGMAGKAVVGSPLSAVSPMVLPPTGHASPTLGTGAAVGIPGGPVSGGANEWTSANMLKDAWMCKMPRPGSAIPDRHGWELVRLVEQNSLMALMLGFMGALGRDRLRRVEAVRRAMEEEARQAEEDGFEEEEEEEEDEYGDEDEDEGFEEDVYEDGLYEDVIEEGAEAEGEEEDDDGSRSESTASNNNNSLNGYDSGGGRGRRRRPGPNFSRLPQPPRRRRSVIVGAEPAIERIATTASNHNAASSNSAFGRIATVGAAAADADRERVERMEKLEEGDEEESRDDEREALSEDSEDGVVSAVSGKVRQVKGKEIWWTQ